jgi:hypothetical protein
MSGHPHWRGQSLVEPGRSGFGSAAVARPGRPRTPARRGLVMFALALTTALGSMVMLIAASSVQAVAETAVFADPKADSWVGMGAVASVLVCALVGMIIVHRYTSGPHR